MLSIAALGVLFSIVDSASAQPAFTVVDLGAFGGSNCVATGINDSGIRSARTARVGLRKTATALVPMRPGLRILQRHIGWFWGLTPRIQDFSTLRCFGSL
jgi:hypothetical protein